MAEMYIFGTNVDYVFDLWLDNIPTFRFLGIDYLVWVFTWHDYCKEYNLHSRSIR